MELDWLTRRDDEPQVEDEVRAQLPAKQGTSPEQTSALEESIYKISGQLSTMTRNQKYFRTRENRNFSTVRSTEKRIVNFSLIQCCMVVCMGGLQVFVVRFFFQVGALSQATRRVRAEFADRLAGRTQGICVNDLREMGWALFDTATWRQVRGRLHTPTRQPSTLGTTYHSVSRIFTCMRRKIGTYSAYCYTRCRYIGECTNVHDNGVSDGGGVLSWGV